MRNLLKLAVVLVVVTAFSVPAFAEILVYATKEKEIFDYEYNGVEWNNNKEKGQGFFIMDVDLDAGTITNAGNFWMYKSGGSKWYGSETMVAIELVELNGKKASWALIVSEVNTLVEVVGRVKSINIGTDSKQEVANSLKGYNLRYEVNNEISAQQITLKLHPKLTKLCNSPSGPNLDFTLSMQAVADYLENKGYQAE